MRKNINRYFRFVNKNMIITSFDYHVIKEYIISKNNFSRNELIRLRCVLKRFFNFVEIFYGIVNKEWAKIIIPYEVYGEELEDKFVLSIKDFKLFISGIEETSIFYLLFLTAFIFRLRISEVRGIKVSDFDFEENIYKLRNQYNETIYSKYNRYVQVKTKKSRRNYYIPVRYKEIVLKYIERNNLREEDYLFKYKHDIPIYKNAINYFLHKRQKECNLPLFRFHTFRRSEASLLNEIGVSGEVIASYIGHESFNVTRQYYLGDSLEKKAKISKIMDEKLEEIISK